MVALQAADVSLAVDVVAGLGAAVYAAVAVALEDDAAQGLPERRSKMCRVLREASDLHAPHGPHRLLPRQRLAGLEPVPRLPFRDRHGLDLRHEPVPEGEPDLRARDGLRHGREHHRRWSRIIQATAPPTA